MKHLKNKGLNGFLFIPMQQRCVTNLLNIYDGVFNYFLFAKLFKVFAHMHALSYMFDRGVLNFFLFYSFVLFNLKIASFAK